MNFNVNAVKYMVLLSLAVCLQLSGYCQHSSTDSIFMQFEKCIKQRLQKQYKIADTSFACFYGNEYNYSMEMIRKGEGRYYNLKSRKGDSLNRAGDSIPFFYRGMSFLEYINFIITQTPNAGCIFPTQKGVWVFVNAPVELWEQFYLDKLVYKDGFNLTPTLDIIQSDGVSVKHKRSILILEYSNGKGFKVKDEVSVREATICPPLSKSGKRK
ncbi:MAG TPA: hypothetical protein VGB46_10110 [Flavisolibacter sp.]|jgi:hypothetical protein